MLQLPLTYSLWKATKKLKRPKTVSPPLRQTNGCWARSDEEKCATFAEHLKDVFQPHVYEGPPEHENEVLREVQLDCDPSTSAVTKFTKQELIRAINNIKPTKAPGYDLITGMILQKLPDTALTFLLSIYNAMSRLCFFPPQWKTAKILMVHKPGKPLEDPKSYRPISLLPVASKVYESLLLLRLLPIIKEKKLIPDHQFGFRQKHGTIDQVHRLVSKIHNTFEGKEYCAAAFLDISQAFDRVWHEGLLYKIKNSFPGNIFLILKSYLRDRYFFVQSGEALSKLCPIAAGVPQGSVFGPILYLIHTADLPISNLATTGTFADDTAVLVSHTDHKVASAMLQTCLDDIALWLKKWRMRPNQ